MPYYDLQEKYNEIVNSKLIAEARPYGFMQGALNTVRGALGNIDAQQRSAAGDTLNRQYQAFKNYLARIGKKEGQTTAKDLLAYMSQYFKATPENSENFKTLQQGDINASVSNPADVFASIARDTNQISYQVPQPQQQQPQQQQPQPAAQTKRDVNQIVRDIKALKSSKSLKALAAQLKNDPNIKKYL